MWHFNESWTIYNNYMFYSVSFYFYFVLLSPCLYLQINQIEPWCFLTSWSALPHWVIYTITSYGFLDTKGTCAHCYPPNHSPHHSLFGLNCLCQEDVFDGELITVKGRGCTCDFAFVTSAATVNVAIGVCDPKCTGTVNGVQLGGPSGVANLFSFGMVVKRGLVKFRGLTVTPSK